MKNQRRSVSDIGKTLNRPIGLVEAVLKIHLSDGDLPRSWNTMADAGSRLQTARIVHLWMHLSHSWIQVPVRIVSVTFTACSHRLQS